MLKLFCESTLLTSDCVRKFKLLFYPWLVKNIPWCFFGTGFTLQASCKECWRVSCCWLLAIHLVTWVKLPIKDIRRVMSCLVRSGLNSPMSSIPVRNFSKQSLIYSWNVLWSLLWLVHSFFQSELSTECN